MTATPSTPRSSASRRALGAALPGGALGATLILVAAGQTWAEGSAAIGRARTDIQVTGSEVTGLPSALALVGLAALVAVFAVRRKGRTAVAALLALCGLGVVVSALLATADTGALEEQAAEATGLADAAVDRISHSGWPYAAVVGGVLLLLAGLLALRFGRYWPAMGGRYERSGSTRRAGATRRPRPQAQERPEDLWQALDRGEDPTEHTGRERPGSTAGDRPVADPGPGRQQDAGAAPDPDGAHERGGSDGGGDEGDQAHGGAGSRS